MSTKFFSSRSWLNWLSGIAVAFALAAATSTVFSAIFSSTSYAWFTIPPTVLVALIWVRVLRIPGTVGKTKFRKSWLLSIPLAALNSSLASVLLFALQMGNRKWHELIGAALAGATVGAIFWIPALFFTLLCFGSPIAWAQRLAQKGLAGEERGEAIVGGASAGIAIGALIATAMHENPPAMDPLASSGYLLTIVSAVTAAIVGIFALLVAREREAQRRNFVADVEAGKVPKFRVDTTPEGKVLVRVVSQENSYRVGDYEEEVAALNREGEVVRPLRVSSD